LDCYQLFSFSKDRKEPLANHPNLQRHHHHHLHHLRRLHRLHHHHHHPSHLHHPNHHRRLHHPNLHRLHHLHLQLEQLPFDSYWQQRW
jgi:hypothetical protein